MPLGIDRSSVTVHIGSMDVGVCGGPYSRRQPPPFRSATRVRRIETSSLRYALACQTAMRPAATAVLRSRRSGTRPPRAPASEGSADCGDIGLPLGQGRLGSHTPAIFVTTANHELDMRPALPPAQIRAIRVGCDLTQLQGGEALGGPTDSLARVRSRYGASSRERLRLGPVAQLEIVHPDSASRRSASTHAC